MKILGKKLEQTLDRNRGETAVLNKCNTPKQQQIPQNTRVLKTSFKPAPSRKQVGVTPVSNTGITLHTSDQHRFYTIFDPTNLR